MMTNRYLFLVALGLMLIGCAEKRATTETIAAPEAPQTPASYPEAIGLVLEAHGGMDLWKAQRTMEYTIQREQGDERHLIDLWSRMDKLELPEAIMGYDGEEVWMVADTSYKKDPVFYHNLMFYFYAMPFVLADDGIIYTDTSAVEFDGVSYPGIKISYEDGVGFSAKDEYILYYHPETFQMAWLGYTVTYFSGEKSPTFKWIRYDDWTDVGGLLLPNSISWYKFDETGPTELRNTVSFTESSLSTEALPIETYQKPAGE